MLNIKDTFTVHVQCTDKNGETGCFFKNDNNEQFGETYKDCIALFNSHEAKFANAHGIEIKYY